MYTLVCTQVYSQIFNFNSIRKMLFHFKLALLQPSCLKSQLRESYGYFMAAQNSNAEFVLFQRLTLLRPGGHWWPLSPKFQFHLKKGLSKKILMSVAPMSRQSKKAYLRLCPEKRRKKEFGP